MNNFHNFPFHSWRFNRMNFFMRSLLQLCILVIFSKLAYSQDAHKFNSAIELGNFSTIGHIPVKPNLDTWTGYPLPGTHTGFSISSINTYNFSKRGAIGAGIGYANYTGYSGFLAYTQLKVKGLDRKVNPIGFINLGYSFFWNHYEEGSSSFLFDFGVGAQYTFANNKTLQLSTGLMIMQLGFYWPVKLSYTIF